MGCLGNLIWMIFGGIIHSLGWFIIGILWSITIVGIPIGKQCFKMASMQFAPFGKEVVTVDEGGVSILANILWIIFGGVQLALANVASGIILCVSIIGIPFGLQCFKLAYLSLVPFGKEIV